MLSSLQMRSMRVAMQEKLATRTTRGRDVEEMNKARWKQTAKDLPVVALGSGLGYASGRLLGEAASKHLLKGSPQTQKMLSYAIPLTTSMLSATGAYAMGHQRALMKQRRDEADMLSKITKKSGVLPPSFIRNRAKKDRALSIVSDDEDMMYPGEA